MLWKLSGTKNTSTKTIRYNTISIRESSMPNSIRRIAATSSSPTPHATAIISTIFGTDGTCCASTCRSGSDMVMTKPSRNAITTTIPSFCVFAIHTPIRSPIGDMASSAPSVKNIIPIMTRIEPIKKQRRMLGEIGVIVNDSISTIATIGITACSASFSFSFNFSFSFSLVPGVYSNRHFLPAQIFIPSQYTGKLFSRQALSP